MTDAFGLLGLLLLLFSGGRSEAAPPRAKPPAIPAGGPPAPWPAALPPDLPRFPGNGWEYDEPPPPVVQERARQLISSLWRKGKGSHQTEQTAGRWITYRAEIVRSGRQGIVAYRLKSAAALPAPRRDSARSPGVPQAPAAQAVPVSFPSSPAPGHVPFPVPGGVIYTAPSSAPSPVAFRTLRRGMGQEPAAPIDDVRIVQQKLGVTPANGRFGPLTETAVKRFQAKMIAEKRAGWKPGDDDGKVGPQTWTALFAVRA